MESKYTTLINHNGEFIKVQGKEILVTDIPVLFDASTTINDLMHKAEYVHIDFKNVQLIGITIVQLHK